MVDSPYVVLDATGEWARNYPGEAELSVVDGVSWLTVPRNEILQGDDPQWFERMFCNWTWQLVYPRHRPEVRLMPLGFRPPRVAPLLFLGMRMPCPAPTAPRPGVPVHEVQQRTYAMTVASGMRGAQPLPTSAMEWPLALARGMRHQILPHDRSVAPYFRIVVPLEELEVLSNPHALRAKTMEVIEMLNEALDAVLCDFEGQGIGDRPLRPWCLRLLNNSGLRRTTHQFLLSLWCVVSSIVMPSVQSVHLHFAAALARKAPAAYRACFDMHIYSALCFPLPWSRDDQGNLCVPVDGRTLEPVCRPDDGEVVLATRLGDYFPTPHVRRRVLLSPIFEHDGTGEEAYWATNEEMSMLDAELYGDETVIRDGLSAAALVAKISPWRLRVPSNVMRLTRNLVAMGIDPGLLEARIPQHREWVESAKRMRPSTLDVHDGVLVKWARMDSERTTVQDGGEDVADGAAGERLLARITTPLSPAVSAGLRFYDLAGQVERARTLPPKPPTHMIGILQTAEIVDEDVRYVRPFPAGTRGLRFVKAALGTGKSVANWETVVLWLKSAAQQRRAHNLRVLVGTPRRTLAAAAVMSANRYLEQHYDPWERAERQRLRLPPRAAPLRFVHYRDDALMHSSRLRPAQQQTVTSSDLCVWQLESFRRLADVPAFDLVLFDEVASLLRCLTGHMVRKCRGQLEETVSEFHRIINSAKLVVVSDGNITTRDVRAISDACARLCASRLMVVYRCIPQRGTVHWYFSEKASPALLERVPRNQHAWARATCTALSKWLSAICRDINHNKNVYVYSGSKRLLTHSLLPLIRESCPGVVVDDDVLLMTAETVDHAVPMDVLGVWSTKRVVAVSPTVTVGLDFSPAEPYFHSVYAYVSAFGAGPRDSVQSMVRVRQTRERVVHVCFRNHLDSVAKTQVPQRCDGARGAFVRAGFVRRVTGSRHQWEKEPAWLEELFFDNSLEDAVARSDLVGCVRTLLLQAGYDGNSGHVVLRETIDDADAKVYQPAPIDRSFTAIPAITLERYQELKETMLRGESVREEDRLAVQRYEFLHQHLHSSNDPHAEEIWNWTCGKRHCLQGFRRLVMQKREADTTVYRILDRDALHTNMITFLPSGNVQLHIICSLYRHVLGIGGAWVPADFPLHMTAVWAPQLRAIHAVAQEHFTCCRNVVITNDETQAEKVVKWLDVVFGNWNGATVQAVVEASGEVLNTKVQWAKARDLQADLIVRHRFVPSVENIGAHIRLTV
jgi:hypothetical protein